MVSGRAGDRAERFQPLARLVIGDLETLRVLADPLRLRIMEAFARDAGEPQTVKRVAATLGEGATKLYYHVNLLEERGLLRMVESRVVSGIIEKRYQPAAHSFTVDRAVLAGSADPGLTDALGATMAAILDGARDDVVEAVREGRILPGPDVPSEQRVVLTRTTGRLTPEQAAAFRDRLRQLHEELDAAGADEPDALPFALTIAFHPSRPQAPEEDAE